MDNQQAANVLRGIAIALPYGPKRDMVETIAAVTHSGHPRNSTANGHYRAAWDTPFGLSVQCSTDEQARWIDELCDKANISVTTPALNNRARILQITR